MDPTRHNELDSIENVLGNGDLIKKAVLRILTEVTEKDKAVACSEATNQETSKQQNKANDSTTAEMIKQI